MADVNIDYTYQSGDNDNTVALVNKVSNPLLGKDADTTGTITKAQIIIRMNTIQKNICKKEFTFMNKRSDFLGYETEATTTDAESSTGAVTGDSTLGNSASVSGQSGLYAYKHTTGGENPQVVSECVFKLAHQSPVGEFTGSLIAYIYSDSGGSPNSIQGTSDTVSVSSGVISAQSITLTTTAQAITFTFSTTVALSAGTNYWIVVKVLHTTGTTNKIYCGTAATASTTSKYKFQGETSWTAYTAAQIYAKVTYYLGTFLTTIEVSGFQRVDRITNGNTSMYQVSLQEYNRNIGYLSNMKQDTFVATGYTDDGNMNIQIKSSLSHVMTWTAEGRKKTPALTSDNDIPVIPSDHRDILYFDTLLSYIAENKMIDVNKANVDLLVNFRNNLWKDMLEIYLVEESSSIEIAKSGSIPNDEVSDTKEPNYFQVSPNSSSSNRKGSYY